MIENVMNSVGSANEEIVSMSEEKDQVLEAITNISVVSEEAEASSEEVSAYSEEQTGTLVEIGQTAQKISEMNALIQSQIEQFRV